MIQYIIPENPDDRIIARANEFLLEGKIISFPTETNWVLAATTSSKKAIDRLYQLKELNPKKPLSLLCSSISQASEYAFIPTSVYKIIRKKVPGPYTFIFKATSRLPQSIRTHRNQKQIGIRIPPSIFCNRLAAAHPYMIAITSITTKMMNLNEDKAESESEGGADFWIFSYMIEEKYGSGVSMIIDPGELNFIGSSTIIDCSDEIPVVLRMGAGEVSEFL